MDRYRKPDQNKKLVFKDTNVPHSCALSQSLPYDGIKLDKNVRLQDFLNTEDNSSISFFVDCYSSYPDIIKDKTKDCPLCPENEISNEDKFNDL